MYQKVNRWFYQIYNSKFSFCALSCTIVICRFSSTDKRAIVQSAYYLGQVLRSVFRSGWVYLATFVERMLALAQRQPTSPGLADYTAAGALFSLHRPSRIFLTFFQPTMLNCTPLSLFLSLSFSLACFRNNRISNGKIRPALADFCVSRVIINMHHIIV